MRWFLKASADSLTFESALSYSNVADAELLLRRFAVNRAAMQTLREALRCADVSAQTHQLRDDEVIRLVAAQIVAGRLTLLPPQPAPLFPVHFYKGSAQNESQGDEKEPKDEEANSKNDSAKVPIEWELVFSDGPGVKGFVSMYEGPDGKPAKELKPDGGGHHKLDDFWRHDAYAVTFKGTVEVSGKLEDAEGKPIKDAKITVEPVYGDAVICTTDGGGAFKVQGFVEEEEFDVFISAGAIPIEGKVTDEKGKGVPGAALRLLLDGGDLISAETGTDGSFSVPGRMPGEGFSIEVADIKPGFAAEGQFVDEDGKPVAGASARLMFDGGRHVGIVADADGKYKVEGILPEEGYSLEYTGR